MKEFLNITLKPPALRNKVMSSFSKVSSAFEDLSLDLCFFLDRFEVANLADETFVDFDFGNLLASIKEVDGPALRSPE